MVACSASRWRQSVNFSPVLSAGCSLCVNDGAVFQWTLILWIPAQYFTTSMGCINVNKQKDLDCIVRYKVA